MKLANKQGTITKLSGNRRKPYMVRTAIVYNHKKQKYDRIIIGYARTKREAELMLLEYNKKNLNISEVGSYSFKDFFDIFLDTKENEVQYDVYKMYKNTINNYLYSLFDKRIDEVKYKELQSLINNLSYGTAKCCKRVLIYVYKEAMKLEIIDKNFAELLTARNKITKEKKDILTYQNIKELWNLYHKNQNELYIIASLIQLYTGCRINEVLKLDKESIFFDNRYIVTGSKTDSGRDRQIPIHNKIYNLLKYAIDNKILPTHKTTQNYVNGIKYFLQVKTNLNFSSHQLRHTFITELQKNNASVIRVKKIVGHKSDDITDGVYTHLDIEDLRNTIELIKY